MLDLSKRLLIVLIMGFCIACMFFSVKTVKAESNQSNIIEETIGWVWPAYGEVTDHYGSRGGNHHGLDIAAPTGTDTFSVDNGVVTKSYYSFSYGHVVFIMHPNGYETVYAHLNERYVVEGQEVTKGEIIGKVGNTGRSRGAHLHFEVHKGEWNIEKSNAVDPLHALDVSVMIDNLVSKEMADKKKELQVAALKTLFDEQETPDWSKVDGPSEQLLAGSVIVSSNEGPVVHSIETIHDYLDKESIKVNKNKEKAIVIDVEQNMTLWAISEKYNVSISSIKEWNDLNSDVIQVGEKLTIYPQKEMVYVVKSGDTLQKISEGLGISAETIKTLNNLDNHIIYPSQVLIITVD